MIKFDSCLHTSEALVDQVAEIYAAAPDTILVGSLGRAMLYEHRYGNAGYELECRKEPILADGIKARDIDVIVTDESTNLPQGPFYTDARAFHNASVAVVQEGGDWILTSAERQFCEVLHPATMEPSAGKGLLGIPGITVPPQTHLALFYTRGGPLRRKDDLIVNLLGRLIEQEIAPLPPDLYWPFQKLAEIKMKRSEAFIRTIYQRMLPRSVEQQLDYLLTK